MTQKIKHRLEQSEIAFWCYGWVKCSQLYSIGLIKFERPYRCSCFVDTFHFALNRMDYICLIDFHNRSLVLFLNATKFAIPILLSNCFHFPLFPPFFCVIMRSTWFQGIRIYSALCKNNGSVFFKHAESVCRVCFHVMFSQRITCSPRS